MLARWFHNYAAYSWFIDRIHEQIIQLYNSIIY